MYKRQAQILKGVRLALGDEPRSFPSLQLAGTDLQNPQDILAAKAGHSSMLRRSNRDRTQEGMCPHIRFPFCSCTWLPAVASGSATAEPLDPLLPFGFGLHSIDFAHTRNDLAAWCLPIAYGSNSTAWIMPRICVDKEGRNNIQIKSEWITRT